MSRFLLTLVVLVLGLSGLLLGLASLQRIFIEERDEAQARVESERSGLQEYARRTLEQLLEGELHAAEVEIMRALDDPLVGATDILLVADGRQHLPRLTRHVPGELRPARDLYIILRSGLQPAVTDPRSPWAERLALHQTLRMALREGGHGSIERAFRDFLRHRTRYVINSVLDIPSTIAAIEDLLERADPSPELLSGLLRDGVRDGGVAILEGLQPAMLRRRDRFTEGDFQFLSGRILALSERVQIAADDFRERIAEPPAAPVRLPDQLSSPSLLADGHWYARSDADGTVVGTAVDTATLMAQIDEQMRQRAMIDDEDQLALATDLGPWVSVATLPITVTAPRFAVHIEDADHNYWIKSAFLVGSFGLAVGLVVLTAVVASRKQRFVELKHDFVATVSHELRTPLASLRLMAETVERRTVGLAAVRDYPGRMVREIDDLAFLVENILSFNRLDKGRWRPHHEPIDLQSLVDDVFADLAQRCAKPLQVRCHGIEQLELRADRELLRLLLHNLGKNACSYCQHPTIELEIEAVVPAGRRGRFTLLLRDNGVGIPRREHRRIFGDFYRGARAPQDRGSGLGLAICRKIMRSHGGRIRIAASSAQGTTFALEFPRALLARKQGHHDLSD